MFDNFYPITSDIWGLFWTPLPTLKSFMDVIYGRSLMNLQLHAARMPSNIQNISSIFLSKFLHISNCMYVFDCLFKISYVCSIANKHYIQYIIEKWYSKFLWRHISFVCGQILIKILNLHF